MENSERRHSTSGKKVKCITERLHNKPQQGTWAQTDSGRRKFCVYSVMASCLSLSATQLFMETHIWSLRRLRSENSEMKKQSKQQKAVKEL